MYGITPSKHELDKLFATSHRFQVVLLLGIIGLVSVPLTILTLYLIIKKTTKRMGNYKNYLLSLTLWNLLLITAMLLLQYEVVDVETMVVVIRGPLKYFDDYYSHIVTFLVIASTNNVATALFLCSLFKYIHLSVSGGLGSVFTVKQLLIISICCHVVVTLLTTTPTLLSYIPTSLFRSMPSYKYNFVLRLLSKETVLVYDPEANKVVVLFARIRLIFGCVIYSLIVLFLILTINSLRKRKAILRKKTFRLQKMMIRTLIIHTLIPIFGLLLPLIVMPLVVQTYVPFLQVLNILLVSISTIFNNLSTIYFIKPYRLAVMKYLQCSHRTAPPVSKYLLSSTDYNSSIY
uniref:G-protein coupled receptors family 1 profile domain-containing protein n=1 Tax=Panagrolaimus sp. JU765 TaxID=591449 RepID=A0AC34RJ06_9BILA